MEQINAPNPPLQFHHSHLAKYISFFLSLTPSIESNFCLLAAKLQATATNGTINNNLVIISAFVTPPRQITIPAEWTECRLFRNGKFIVINCKNKNVHLDLFFKRIRWVIQPMDAPGSFFRDACKESRKRLLLNILFKTKSTLNTKWFN